MLRMCYLSVGFGQRSGACCTDDGLSISRRIVVSHMVRIVVIICPGCLLVLSGPKIAAIGSRPEQRVPCWTQILGIAPSSSGTTATMGQRFSTVGVGIHVRMSVIICCTVQTGQDRGD